MFNIVVNAYKNTANEEEFAENEKNSTNVKPLQECSQDVRNHQSFYKWLTLT